MNPDGSIPFLRSLDGAVAMVARGFKVFPLKQNSEEPAVKDFVGWIQDSSKEELECFAAGRELNYGCVPAASGHIVLDVDGEAGRQTLLELVTKHGELPVTFAVRTQSGGMHYYFKGPSTRPTRGKLGLGLNTRGAHSYVVVPRSKIDGKPYVIIDDSEPVECPQWILDGVSSPAKRTPKGHTQSLVSAAASMNERVMDAIDYLENAPVCIEGGGEHSREYLLQIFCGLRDRGIVEALAWDLFVGYYNARCQPSWRMGAGHSDEDHAYDKLLDAYHEAQDSFGPKSAETKLNSVVLPFLRASEIDEAKIKRREWIIQDMLLAGQVSLTAAPGGTGKSNLEILKAIAVVTGRNDLLPPRYAVKKPGPCLLFNAEDPRDEMERRVLAFSIALGVKPEKLNGLCLLSGQDHSLAVASPKSGEPTINWESVNTIIATAKAMGAVAISFDPLIEMHAVNENDNSAMSLVIRAFKQAAAQIGCAVSLVHHTNKAAIGNSREDSDSQKNFRGAYSLVGAARVALTVKTMDAKEARVMGVPLERRCFFFKLELAKANFSPPAERADWFENCGIELPNGETVGVCRVAPLNAAKTLNDAKKGDEEKRAVLEFLRIRISSGGQKSLNEIQEEAIERAQPWATKNTSRIRDRLMEAISDGEEFVVAEGKRRTKFIRRKTNEERMAEVIA